MGKFILPIYIKQQTIKCCQWQTKNVRKIHKCFWILYEGKICIFCRVTIFRKLTLIFNPSLPSDFMKTCDGATFCWIINPIMNGKKIVKQTRSLITPKPICEIYVKVKPCISNCIDSSYTIWHSKKFYLTNHSF